MPLPRPWGNAADDVFQSIEPIPGGPLTMEDLKNEKVETDASLAVIAKLGDPNLTDETLLKYIQHPEYDLRSMAMDQVVKRGKVELVVPLLKSDDPRLRQAGLLALTGMFKGSPLPADKVTPEMYDLAGRMIDNPDESWWVALHAIDALGRATPEVIAKHRDRLLQFLDYDCTWLQTAAVCTLAKISTDPAHYKTVLPAIIDKSASFRVDSASSRSSQGHRRCDENRQSRGEGLRDPPAQENLREPCRMCSPSPTRVPCMTNGAKTIRTRIGDILQQVPGGEEFVRHIPKNHPGLPHQRQGFRHVCLHGKFTPNPAVIGTWAWAVYPQPNNPSEIDACITAFLKAQWRQRPRQNR